MGGIRLTESSARSALTTAITTATKHAPSHTRHRGHARFCHLLHERLYGFPFGVVSETKLFLITLQHALLHLSGVPITTAGAAALTTLATIAAAIIVFLREQAGSGERERGRHGAKSEDTI